MSRPQITRVRIKDYKSIGQADVRLEPLTIFVGRNGSGKSNFRDTLHLVAESLQSSLEFAIRQRGGVSEVRRRSTGHPRHFQVAIDLVLADGLNAYFGFEVGATKDGGFEVVRERAMVEVMDSIKPAEYEIQRGEWSKASSHVQIKPKIGTDRLALTTLSALPEFRDLNDTLSQMRFYNIDPNSFRQPQPHDAGDVLLPSGKNIGAVIRRLTQDDSKAFERIQQYMKGVVPGLDRVEHESFGPAETLVFFQQVQGSPNAWRFYAASVSDGTLRSLGVLTALFQTHPRWGRPSLVGIEEPESTIHPGAASVLMDALIEASQQHQVILTTHSPDMLDHPSIDISSIRIVENYDGTTVVAEADEASKSAVQGKLYTPGELLRQKQLEPHPAVKLSKAKQLPLFTPGFQ